MKTNKSDLQFTSPEEQKQVKRDLIKVLAINGLIFAGMLALFFYNQETGNVDAWFGNIFKF